MSMQYSCPKCMASFRLPDGPGVPAEVRCKYCGERISLADAAVAAQDTPSPSGSSLQGGTPHTKRRVTAANQAVRIRVPTAVRKLGFAPRPLEPVDEVGATRAEPIPESLAAMAAPNEPEPTTLPTAPAAPESPAPGSPPSAPGAAAPGPPPSRPPTARERAVPPAVAARLVTASLPASVPSHGASRQGEADQLTRTYSNPAGAHPPGADPSEAATVMRPTPAGLTRAAARYRRTSPAVAVQGGQGPRVGPRRGASAPAPRGGRPPASAKPSEAWVPSPALWAFVGALLGAAVIALLFALFH